MKLKPYHSFIIFAVFMLSAVCASVSSYRSTQDDIVSDMNRALVITLHERQDQWLTPDTIQDYRSHLSISLLKETSTLCYVVDDKRGFRKEPTQRLLTSKAMALNSHAIKGYANCSFADVFGMSDQRTPLSLMLTAMLWAACATLWHRSKNGLQSDNAECAAIAANGESVAVDEKRSVGALSYSIADDCFYNSMNHQEVKFTPMQHQLMRLFFGSKRHQLSKQEICSTLWPKKPDASETLYTLIRRIKPIAESNGLTIVSERGRAYMLKEQLSD